ncbi:DUF2203 family protein [archaeon]|nr:DUF2203 family protein [archaeon]MBL7056665.1 DUF2203 family protein [Candidatus Woesearchaeota archaeon]
MEKTHLSLEEAEELITKIKPSIIKLMRINKVLLLLKSVRIEYDDPHMSMTYNLRKKKKLYKLSYDFYNLLDKLHTQGCLVRDLNRGEVDFHSMFDGREIMLCWQISEKNIRYWHEADGGRETKKPVSMLIKIRKRLI